MTTRALRSAAELRQFLERHFDLANPFPAARQNLEMMIDGIPVEIRLSQGQCLLVGHLGRIRDLGRDACLGAARLALAGAARDPAGLAYDEARELIVLTCALPQTDPQGLLATLHALIRQALIWGDALGRARLCPSAATRAWGERWRPI